MSEKPPATTPPDPTSKTGTRLVYDRAFDDICTADGVVAFMRPGQRDVGMELVRRYSAHERLVGALREALARMDRARNILRGEHANWGMLDTADLSEALAQAGEGE